jgi:hypothetical protein
VSTILHTHGVLDSMRKMLKRGAQMPDVIEEAILDKNLTDDEVYDIIMNSQDDVPKSDGITAHEWGEQMDAYGKKLQRLGDLADQHRPLVVLRMIRELSGVLPV